MMMVVMKQASKQARENENHAGEDFNRKIAVMR